VIGCGFVEFRCRWSARFSELAMIPAADTGDKFPTPHRCRPVRYRLLQLSDAERSFYAPFLVARVYAGPCVVDMRIDESWDNCSAAEVDNRQRRDCVSRGSDVGDPTVGDRQRFADEAAVIDEATVDQRNVRSGL